jgi:hypothetical protein
MQILEAKVKPERMKLKDTHDGQRYKQTWWKWGRTSVALNAARNGLRRVLAHPFTSTHVAFAFLSSDVIVGAPHIVITLDAFSAFGTLQCRVHEVWARAFASSMKDDLRYAPSDCFDTFPFPEGFETDPRLEAAGKAYYEFRAALMVRNNEGLTKTYNRFHDPEENSPDILKLRDLHAAMDRAVLDAYGWKDIPTACEFLLDYEEDEEDGAAADTGKGRKKRKPYRYRWPDAVRDEVLARLLALNAKRAEEERLGGVLAKPTREFSPKHIRKQVSAHREVNPRLFDEGK